MKRKIKTKMLGAHEGKRQRWLDKTDTELAKAKKDAKKLAKELAVGRKRRKK